jgi:phosphoglycolate phosphatase
MTDHAVIFDLDGTLVDTAPDLMAATNHVLAMLKRRAITMTEVRSFVGYGAKKLIERGVAATGDEIGEQAMGYYHAEFLRYYECNIAAGSFAFPGAVALLERLKARGTPMGVCTNKLEGLSVSLLDALDLSGYFGAVVGPDTINVAKPDPAPYRETLRRLGATQSLMVGDSETDILTARAAGVPIIAVTFGYTQKHVSHFNPDFIVSHFDEMWPIIEKTLHAGAVS